MDALYASGVLFAEVLQSGPPWLERFWLWATFLGDPKCVFIVCFPLAYFLNRKVGVAVLWIGLIAEWLNVVLKWFLFGERPFWWVYESGFASKDSVQLRQFPVSCETGPGSPSGHCMITGAALWPMVTALSAAASRHSSSRLVHLAPFVGYFLLLLAVGLSRIFILAHFPHQVLGGILAGAALGWLLEAHVPTGRELRFYGLTSLGLLLSACLMYCAMIALGTDLDWSIHLATTWCRNPDWIRMDTRPFASLIRDSGTALGLGLAACSSTAIQQKHEGPSWKHRAVCALVALPALHLLSNTLQPENVALWYGLSFVKYVASPWVVVVLVPHLVHSIPYLQPKPHAA
ncbi:glucose-6-phosphatase 3 [Alligator sinensis]|uniref:Glucose-6-phosphatase n=1 Tax=Alligator sinensis TaxID=38654 RepID=A0A1U7RH28_ALLSI|nr:glucose-6-phosphatase 3 [Alligator sinensis]XP_025052692.1 glucose-6-phosphatase 3 [Alligator sinensis]